jgi:3-deoxy-7-phosphoheptulonate synthase
LATFHETDDLRIKWTKVVLPPVFLEEEMPMTDAASDTVFETRKAICDVLAGVDKRLIVVVGPCSIHDTKAAREYAAKLKDVMTKVSKELVIVMRVYFEKPRTTIGWKGLINDPYLDNSYKINDGLRMARRLLLDIAEMGVPAGTEFLDMISPQYVAVAGELGSDWRAHHREPDPSPTGERTLLPGGLQERDLGRCADCD